MYFTNNSILIDKGFHCIKCRKYIIELIHFIFQKIKYPLIKNIQLYFLLNYDKYYLYFNIREYKDYFPYRCNYTQNNLIEIFGNVKMTKTNEIFCLHIYCDCSENLGYINCTYSRQFGIKLTKLDMLFYNDKINYDDLWLTHKFSNLVYINNLIKEAHLNNVQFCNRY